MSAAQGDEKLCTKETVKRTGFNVWASGEHNGSGPEVDIVAVQGLGADAYYTWARKHTSTEVKPTKKHRLKSFGVHRKNAQIDPSSVGASTASDTAECMWLRDILPNAVLNARVATYSYDSDWRDADIKTSLRKCGEQLLNVLLQNRSAEKEKRRPLVFIGHSLGGLVIKQALVVAVHGAQYSDIRFSMAGIIFLGTPHQGSEAAKYGLWFARMQGLETRLLESLRRNSDDLHHIARDFEASYADTDIVCYYEDKDALYGPLRTQFVDHQSATLNGRRAIYLTTDHSGLNKFHGPEDENFILVRREVQRLVRTAPQRIAECNRLHVETEKFRVNFSLKGIPVVEKFVGRNEEMIRIRQALLPTSGTMRRKIFVIHGLGGIGKTQLSVEFTRTYQECFSAALWIDGSSKERVRRSIADLAERLPQHQLLEGSRTYLQNGSTDVDEVVKDVLRWLSRSSNDQWLLIFDNVDRDFSVPSGDPEAFDVRDYFPTADQGSILITSRLASLSQLGMGTKLEPVDGVQGTSILENSLERSAEGSLELVKLLQGLPLAIKQAGSYMRMTNTNVSGYITMYNRAWAKLMERQHGHTLGDRSMLTTWTLSYDSLRSKSEHAAKLLMLWAFLDNQDLWYELLTPALEGEFVDQLPPWFTNCVDDEFEFKECIGLLRKYSFIDVKTESSSFSIHPVLHHWCSHAFERDKATMGWLAVIVVASAVPDDKELHSTIVGRRLLPHCDHVYSMLQEHFWNEDDQLSVGYACHWLGDLCSDHGKTREAGDLYQRALFTKEKVLGLEHESTLETVNSLGVLYDIQGKQKEAEEMYLRALVGRENHGREHSQTLDVINNLGVLYDIQGKQKEAEEMYLRALVGRESHGPEHSKTLDVINNLGSLYKTQGKEKEAEDMYLRALAGKEKVLGSEHRDTLATKYNLGNLYSDQGRMAEAEDMYLRVLVGREKIFGSEHIETLKTKNNLGVLYFNQGRIEEAEDMYLRALAGKEKALGPEHKETLDTRYNLGFLYENMSRFGEAVLHYELAAQGYTKLRGPEHEETLKTMSALGSVYSDQGRTGEAEDMYLRALVGREKTLGPEHKKTLDTRFNLGLLYAKTSRFVEAVHCFELAAQGYTKLLGPEYEYTIDALKALEDAKADLREQNSVAVGASAATSSSASKGTKSPRFWTGKKGNRNQNEAVEESRGWKLGKINVRKRNVGK